MKKWMEKAAPIIILKYGYCHRGRILPFPKGLGCLLSFILFTSVFSNLKAQIYLITSAGTVNNASTVSKPLAIITSTTAGGMWSDPNSW